MDAWMVTSGAYSDYGVDAVFTTREAADAWAADSNARKSEWADKCEVSRIDLDPPLPSAVEAAARSQS